MEEFERKNPTTSIITPVLNQTINFYLKSEQSLKTFIKLSMPMYFNFAIGGSGGSISIE